MNDLSATKEYTDSLPNVKALPWQTCQSVSN
jgi:hypothetical protein